MIRHHPAPTWRGGTPPRELEFLPCRRQGLFSRLAAWLKQLPKVFFPAALLLALPAASHAQSSVYKLDSTLPTANPFGTFVLGIRNVAGSTLCNADGRFCTFTFDDTGALRVAVAGASSGDGAILDGASPSIRATVFDLTNSNPLSTQIVDANGDAITSFGGGTQYDQGTATTATDSLTMAGAVRRDTASVDAGVADGDRTRLATDGSGRLRVTSIDVTQPISVATLPLPTGAATAALQTQPGVDIGDVTINNAAGAAAVNIQDGGNSITIDGSLTTVTTVTTVSAVTAITNALPAGNNNIGDVDVASIAAGNNNIGDVDIASFPDNEPFNEAQRGGSAIVADPCMREARIPISISQTTGTQLITGTASERIFICSFHVITATAQNVALVSGTGTVCATSTSGVTGFGGATAATGWNFSANGGIQMGHSEWSYGKTDTDADNVCLFQSGAGQVSGGLTYVSAANF